MGGIQLTKVMYRDPLDMLVMETVIEDYVTATSTNAFLLRLLKILMVVLLLMLTLLLLLLIKIIDCDDKDN